MRYLSTRGGVGYKTFEEALFSGYANDGGLLVPEHIPQISLDDLKKWKNLSYPCIVEKIVSCFVTEEELPHKTLQKLIFSAFSRFDTDKVIEIASFGDLNIAELWHGPSLAFKDLAMSVVGELYSYFLSKRKKHVNIVVGTSGDTGSSAIEAVRGKDWIDIIVILPHKRISKIQELMMTTALDGNVHVYAADGFSDEFEITIKSLFADEEFVRTQNLCSINSINWARVMVQIAHHVYLYLRTANPIGSPVDIVIPTGGCGNIASGVFAEAMGVPVKFVCVTNENDIIHRIISSNDFTVAQEVKQTLACSMDIQIPSNFERVLWVYSGSDPESCKQIMGQFDKSGRAVIPEDLHKKLSGIRTAVATDREVLSTQKICYDANKYIACPHTSAALTYYYETSLNGSRKSSGTRLDSGELVPVVICGTASIDKFPDTLGKSGIRNYKTPRKIAELFQKVSRFCIMNKDEDWENTLRNKIDLLSRRAAY